MVGAVGEGDGDARRGVGVTGGVVAAETVQRIVAGAATEHVATTAADQAVVAAVAAPRAGFASTMSPAERGAIVDDIRRLVRRSV